MDFSKAEKEALAIMTSGFKHQTYEDELRSSSIFELIKSNLLSLLINPLLPKKRSHYNNVLGRRCIAHVKNGSNLA
jgi:hypothetical protein